MNDTARQEMQSPHPPRGTNRDVPEFRTRLAGPLTTRGSATSPPFYSVVVEHLRPLRAFRPMVFAWDAGRECLHDEFTQIQKAADTTIECAT